MCPIALTKNFIWGPVGGQTSDWGSVAPLPRYNRPWLQSSCHCLVGVRYMNMYLRVSRRNWL